MGVEPEEVKDEEGGVGVAMGFTGQGAPRTHWAGHQLPIQSLRPSQHILHAQLHGQFIDVLQEGEGQVHAAGWSWGTRPSYGRPSRFPGLPQSSIALPASTLGC